MKTAIVHDWLTGMRGGEKVLEVFCEIFPDADIFTLMHIPGSVSKVIEDRNIKTSFIQSLPLSATRYRHYLPILPLAIEKFNMKGYDLIVSISHCVAKGIIPPPDALHISYVHSPMRYVWDMYEDYFGRGRAGWFSKAMLIIFAHYLRMWDVSSSSRVDYFIANSNHVAKRIEKYYRRTAEVIYPPVDCSKFEISDGVEDFYLMVSAFAPYKRIDLAIEVFNRLGLPLKVIGDGQVTKKIKRLAKSNVEFLGWQNDEILKSYYAKCKALIFPGEEDFGIVPLEAMSSGRPVIAYGRGGVLETVVPLNRYQDKYPTGVFFYEQTPDALIEAVKLLEENQEIFNSDMIRSHALGFDREIFKKKVKDYIHERYKEFNRDKREWNAKTSKISIL